MALTGSEKRRVLDILDEMDSSRRRRIRAQLQSFLNWLADVAEFIIKELTRAALRHLIDTYLNFS